MGWAVLKIPKIIYIETEGKFTMYLREICEVDWTRLTQGLGGETSSFMKEGSSLVL